MKVKKKVEAGIIVVGLGLLLGCVGTAHAQWQGGPGGAASSLVPPALSGYTGAVGITGNRTNGSDQVQNACINGVCPGTAFGMLVANTDNSTQLQAAINAAYETGTASATKAKVTLGPDSTGGTTYKFTGPVDFKTVPVECAGTSMAESVGLFNITLDFTGVTSGYFIVDARQFKNCRVLGTSPIGQHKSVGITSISVSNAAERTLAVVTSTAMTTCFPGQPITFSGTSTTLDRGWFPIAGCTDSSHFTFQGGLLGTQATINAGTVFYGMTVGVSATNPSAATPSMSSQGVDWENLLVSGAGAAYNLSSSQLVSGGGSENNWWVINDLFKNALVGLLANGNGTADESVGTNVANGHLIGFHAAGSACVAVMGGPPVPNFSSPEEMSFGANQIDGTDFEVADTDSADCPAVAGIIADAEGNRIEGSYLSAGGSGGAGQTALGTIRDTDGTGGNTIRVTRAGGNGLVISSNDEVRMNINAAGGQNQVTGAKFKGGLSIEPDTTTPDPVPGGGLTCKGTCTGASHAYGLVAEGWDGNKYLASTNFLCTDGVTYVSSGGVAGCPANTGPNPYSGSNFVAICYKQDPNIKNYYLLLDDTAHVVTNRNPQLAGANGNNCLTDSTATTSAFTPPTNSLSGGIKETNSSALNRLSTIQFNSFTFANIATFLTANGQIGYCSDCTIANPCAGSGTGAMAKRLNGVNVCN